MATWVPEKDRTTAWWIFSRLFMCRVTNIQSMSVEYIEKFGMPASGYEQYDKETANELVTRMLSINDMVEYFRNGVTVHVVNFKDTKEIYERISDHLNLWKQKLENSFHVKDAPIDDLLLLDKFANVVYKYAAPQFTTEMVDSLIARRMSSAMKFNRQNILSPLKNKVINPIDGTTTEESKIPERVSMSDSFLASRPNNISNKKWK
jgi:hypothetical protein